MSDRSELQHELASRRQLVKAGGISALAAAVLLLVAILPAEYGVDPTGIGRALGLTQMSAPPKEEVFVPPQGSTAYTPVLSGASALYGAAYQTDTVEFVIDGYDYIEFKYHLVQGAPMVFSWTSSAVVTHDFHGEPDADPENGVQSFDKSDKRNANGSIVAPFTGVHGWFWENPNSDPVTIRVTSAGFYSSAVEIKSNRSRVTHEVAPAVVAPKE